VAEELTELVRNDRGAARDAALSLCVHASLMQELRPEASFKDMTLSIMDRVRSLHVPKRRTAPTVHWGVWTSVAACLAIIVGSLFYNARQSDTLSEKILAHVAATSPNVTVVRDGRTTVAVLKMTLEPGDRIRTDAGERITIGYEKEDTTIELGEDTELTLLTHRPAEGKRYRLDAGTVTARAAAQLATRPMIFFTPHAEARVKGTVFSLTVKNASTRLDVTEGLVELSRTSDGASVEVSAGHYAKAGAGIELAARPIPAGDLLLQLVEKASGVKTVADMKALKELAFAAYDAEFARAEACDPVRLVYLGLARAIARNPKEDRQVKDLRFILDRAAKVGTAPEPPGNGIEPEQRATIRESYNHARRLAEELYFDKWFAIISPLMEAVRGRLPALTEALWLEDHYVTFYERGLPQFSVKFWNAPAPRDMDLAAVRYCARNLFPLMKAAAERSRRLEDNIPFSDISTAPKKAWEARKHMIEAEQPHLFVELIHKDTDTRGNTHHLVFPHIPFKRAVLTGQVRASQLGSNAQEPPILWGLTTSGSAFRGQGVRRERIRNQRMDLRWTWFLILFQQREPGRWGMARREWLEGNQPHDLTSPDPTLPPTTAQALTEKENPILAVGNKTYTLSGNVHITLGAREASVEWRALGLRILDEQSAAAASPPAPVRYVDGPVIFTDDFSKGLPNWRFVTFPETAPVGWDNAKNFPVAVEEARIHGASVQCAVIDAADVSSTEVLIGRFNPPVNADAFVVSAYVFLTPPKKGPFSFGAWYRPSAPGNEKTKILAHTALAPDQTGTWTRVRTEYIRRPDKSGKLVWVARTFRNDRLTVHVRNTSLYDTVHFRMSRCKVKIADFSIRKLVPASEEDEK